MATIDNYKIKITVDGKEQVIDLNDKVDDLANTLSKASAAGIAAFSALGISAVKMASDMDGLAKATGIATGDIYKLSKALEISGGEFNDGGRILQAFSKALGQVETGSQETIDALSKLGIGRQELETLSDQELFNRVIQGLGGMQAGFERTQLAMELLGKGAAGLEFDKLAAELQKASDPEVARRFELAGDAIDNISSAFRELQGAALQAIMPILEALAQFEFTSEDAKKAIQVLGALIAAAFAASVVLQIQKVINLFKTMGQVIRGAAAAQAFLTGLTGVGLAAVAASAAAATAAYVALGKAMEGAADEKAKLDGTTAPGATTPETGGGRTVGLTPEEKQLATIKAQTVELRKKNEEANRYQRLINSTINLSEREATIIRTNADFERQAANDKLAIQKQIDTELAKGKDANQSIVQELKQQIIEVDKQLGIQKQLKQEELDRLQTQKLITDEINKSAMLEEFNLQARIDAQKSLLTLQAANGEITDKQAKIGIELAQAQARYESQRIALAQKRALLLDKATAQELADQETLERMNETRYANELRRIAELEAAEVLKSQNIFKGIEDSMASIGKAFTPYQMAQDAILQTWGKIGSAIDNFIDTGKFKFKDFAASVIADLGKMIAKALVFKAIQSALGAFGFSIPGLAEGGPAKAGQPYIVGEKGPELFVPKQAGTVIPNNGLEAKTQSVATGAVNAPVTNNYITNNISALDAKSVAELFAANRKTLLGTVKMAERELPYMA